MTTATIVNVGHLRSQLATIDKHAERAFELAFDLRQACAAEEKVESALAEFSRLQESARQLREQLEARAG